LSFEESSHCKSFLPIAKLQLRFLSSSLLLTTQSSKDAFNVIHVRLLVYLLFKQHPNSWHNLSSLYQSAFIHTRVKQASVDHQ